MSDCIYYMVNWFWSAIVVAPVVVIYWRGTWDLLADLVYPNNVQHPATQRQISGLVCYLAGLVTRIVMDMVKGSLQKFLEDKEEIIMKVVSWLFTALYALAGVSFWRGVWFLMKMDVGVNPVKLFIILSVSIAVLFYTGVSRSLIASPLGITLDTKAAAFHTKMFFERSSESKMWLFLDTIFTNLVIRQLIVFSWWSLWSLLNTFLLQPKVARGEGVSYDSLILGYIGAGLCLIFDRVIQNSVLKNPYMMKLTSMLVTLLAFFSSVNVWRGMWSLLNMYFLPSLEPDGSYLIGHVLGLTALSALKLSNTIATDGIAEDSDEAVVDIQYWGRDNHSYTPVRRNNGRDGQVSHS